MDIKGLKLNPEAFICINGMGKPTWYCELSVILKGKR